MPKRIKIATWLYVAAVVFSLYDNGFFGPKNSSDSLALFLMAKGLFWIFAAPILAFQGFLFYKIWKRRGWAAYALLTFIIFVTYREFPGYRLALMLAEHRSIIANLRGPYLAFVPPLFKLSALGLLFSKESRRWLLEGEANRETGAAGQQKQKWPSRYRAIVIGVLTAAAVLGAVRLFSYMSTEAVTKATGGDSDEFKPGNPNYPSVNATPTHIIPFIASGLEYGKLTFNASYVSDVKLCAQVNMGGQFPYGLSIPIPIALTQDNKYRGDIVIDKFEAGRCGWKFGGVSYEWPHQTGGNPIATFDEHTDATVSRTPHVDIWCFKVTEGQFKSPDPQCEILAILRWPNAVRRLNPAFRATFSRQQLSDGERRAINADTKELTIELHDLNAIPDALLPVGDREQQIKAGQEADAYRDTTPEYKALMCVQAANLEYIRTHRPLPDSATQVANVNTMKEKCRAESEVTTTTSQPTAKVAPVKDQIDASPMAKLPTSQVTDIARQNEEKEANGMAEKCGLNSFHAWLSSQPNSVAYDEKTAKLQDSIGNCRRALGLASGPQSTVVPAKASATLVVPPTATAAMAPANETMDRARREALADQCEREESQKLAWFWKQRPDEATRAAKVRELMHNCLVAQHLPDSAATRPQ